MTGFGKAEGTVGNKKVSIQLRSLNSKQADVSVKVPSAFKELELLFRKQIATDLLRGKVEMYLSFQADEESKAFEINTKVFRNYHQQIQALKEELAFEDASLLESILKMPEVIQSKEEEIEKKDQKLLGALLSQAINGLQDFRETEGLVLATDLKSNITAIEDLLTKALEYEGERTEIVRNRLQNNLEESNQKEKIDKDRFEQEMIYYLEKYDISEEKVRLKSHCDYFVQTMNEEVGQGKKLGFISQEIGREINTLGSKANHAEMQKIVVQMKDHLEKIKEQVLNVL